MEEFENANDLQDSLDIENEEKIDSLEDKTKEATGFDGINVDEDFFLSDEPEKKKSRLPIIVIIAVLVAAAVAVGSILIVRHNRQNQYGETILITNPEETITAEIRDGEIYINDQKVDPEEVGIDPDDPEEMKKFVSSVNKGTVTLPSSVAQRVTKYSSGNSSSGNSSGGQSSGGSSSGNTTGGSGSGTPTTSGTTGTTKAGQVVKPGFIYITSPVVRKFEVGYKGKIVYTFGPVYTTERGVNITSSDPSVVSVDHLGNFKALKVGKATIKVQSKANSSAEASITLSIVDATTTIKVVVPTVTTTARPTTTTTTTTTRPTTTTTIAHNEPIAITNMKFTTGDKDTSRIINVGAYTTLSIIFEPGNASVSDVTFVSSNESICTVDSNGRVTGVSKGTATVTVYPKTGSAANLKANITVQ